MEERSTPADYTTLLQHVGGWRGMATHHVQIWKSTLNKNVKIHVNIQQARMHLSLLRCFTSGLTLRNFVTEEEENQNNSNWKEL